MSQVILKAGHVQPVWAGHPWIFPQGIERTRGSVSHGDEVEVVDAKGNRLGRGTFAEGSSIAVRIYTHEEEHLDRDFFVKRLRKAQALRAALGLPDGQATTGYRAVHAEGDRLPGLVVDCFEDVLVIQLGTAALARRREALVAALVEVYQPRAIVERTAERVARSENFLPREGLLFGSSVAALCMNELGLRYRIPAEITQKTGYYFDQRPLRARVAELSRERRVLDTYCFVGSLGLGAKRAGAKEVVCVDSSAPALALGQAFAEENQLDIRFVRAKALEFLGREEPPFDLVIADPPKLAQSRAGLKKAMSAFRRIASAAVGRTAPEGVVILSSCSSALGIDQVERCLALGARDAGREVTVFDRLFQGGDHPVVPALSEGRYLSTVLAYVS